MDDPKAEVPLEDAALRAIGGNLLSLQRLEKVLKTLAGLRPVACKLPEIVTKLEQRRKTTELSTLGTAISGWLETARGGEPRAPTVTSDLDVLVCFWLQLDIGQDVLDEHAKELQQILAERNWFVHHGLAEIDFDCNEDCRKLIARLDEQETRVIKQIDFLRPIVNRMLEVNQFLLREDVQQTLRQEILTADLSNEH